MKSTFFGALEWALNQKIADTREAALPAVPLEDLNLANFRVGYLQGLQEALRLAEEVDQQMLGVSPGASSRVAT